MSDTAQGYGEGIHGLGGAATLIRGDQDVVVGPLVAVYIHPAKHKPNSNSFRKTSKWRRSKYLNGAATLLTSRPIAPITGTNG